MTDEADIMRGVRAYILENFLYMRPGLEFSDDDSLLRKGVIDSLGIMELVGFVEEQYGVRPAEAEVTEANFGSVRGIARYVAAQRGATAGTGPRK